MKRDTFIALTLIFTFLIPLALYFISEKSPRSYPENSVVTVTFYGTDYEEEIVDDHDDICMCGFISDYSSPTADYKVPYDFDMRTPKAHKNYSPMSTFSKLRSSRVLPHRLKQAEVSVREFENESLNVLRE